MQGENAMTEKPDLAERIGRAINELDIDFSRLSPAGWIVSALAMGVGGGVAYALARVVVEHNGLGKGAGLVFCLTIIAVTTIMFLSLRWLLARCGIPITRRD